MIIPITTRTYSTPPAGAALGSFGDKLRKQRELRGLELDAISNTTKISPRMLRALEDEHFDQLPGGVFNKGFVRAYARQVGLDEEEAITDYLAALRESQVQQQTILPDFRSSAGKVNLPLAVDKGRDDLAPGDRNTAGNAPLTVPGLSKEDGNFQSVTSHKREFDKDNSTEDRPKVDRRKQTDRRRDAEVFPTQGFITGPEFAAPSAEPSNPIVWRKFAAALFLVLVVLAFWNLRRRSEAKIAAQPAAPTTQSSPPPVVASTSAQPTKAVAQPLPTEKPSSLSKTAAAKTNPVPTAPVAAASTPAASAPAAPAPVKASAPAAEVKPASTFTVLIRAEKTTWVAITADGKPVAHETLIAPAHTSVRAAHEISVRVGSAAGVSFLMNGKEFPAQGLDGEVKTYVFDPTGFRIATQSQSATQPASANQ